MRGVILPRRDGEFSLKYDSGLCKRFVNGAGDVRVPDMNFTYPPKAVEHEEEESGIVKNYDEKGNLTGLTIIAAKRFSKAKDEEW